jgi:hypothetical protein|tara:strand:- start:105 stop:1157 length:1053 start_codon:yes stop_codon:yes gene_type:complete
MKKICIISIRGSIVYDGMGSCVPDSICEVVKRWIQERDGKYDFSYHRVNLHGKKNPRRNLQAIKEADILLFISYSEFIYHIKNRIGGWEYRRSWNDLLDIREIINPDKQVVWLFSSDNRDDTELFEKYVFPDKPIKIVMFDENLQSPVWKRNGVDRKDWLGNVHSRKIDWIKSEYNKLKVKPERTIDFIYWGSSKRLSVGGGNVGDEMYRGYGKNKTDYRKYSITKGIESGDERHLYLKAIKKDKNINSYFIGSFKGDGFTSNEKWKPMKDILPLLFQSKITICFNWFDNGSNLTSRLYECIGSGVIPILVGNYGNDVSEFIGIENKDYYRVSSVEECMKLVYKLKNTID